MEHRWFDTLDPVGVGLVAVFILAITTNSAWVLLAYFVGLGASMADEWARRDRARRVKEAQDRPS